LGNTKKKKSTKKPKPKKPVTIEVRFKRWKKRWEALDEIEDQLDRGNYIEGDKRLTKELEAYLKDPVVLPEKLDSSNKKNVRNMQKAVAKLDAQQSRVAAIQFSVAKILQLLERLEAIVRGGLLEAKLIDQSSTGPKQKVWIDRACPTLLEAKTVWLGMEKLTHIVNSKLVENKRSIKLQVTMDENARWADKIAP
jgi:hypothetical protein